MHKLAMTLLAAVVVVWIAAKTNVASYASVLWTKVAKETKNTIPTRFEIERVRNEIAQLDADLGAMIRPIAEHKADVTRLTRDVRKSEDSLAEQREALLRLSKDLEPNPKAVILDGEPYPADRVRRKLERDFESFRRLEKHLESQRKLLEAKEASLQAAQEQLAKLVSKKQEYEVRLARLSADEETLQVARIGTKVEFDPSRANHIEQALADIEHRHEVQRAEIELTAGKAMNDSIPTRKEPSVTPGSVRQYLEGSNVVQR
jgi:peptidoglycan hydrolase CwlO-like protein